MWEEAFKSLLEYHDITGEWYKSINLGNYTGYERPQESWDTAPVSEPKPETQPTQPSTPTQPTQPSTPTLTDSIKKHVAAAIWNGNYGWGNGSTRVNRLNEVFGSNNGIQAIVNKGASYIAGTSPSGYSYTDMRKKFKGYASGTRKAAPGMHAVDELGAEYLFTSADGNRYRVFSGGEKVLNAKATEFLYEFANSGKDILEKIAKSFIDTNSLDRIQPIVNHNDIHMGDITIQGNADNTDCMAVFVDMSVPLIKYLNRSMTDYESDTATVIAANAFYQFTNLSTATTSANTIGDSAFLCCTALTKVDLTGVSAAQIAANAFSGCTKLAHLIIRSNSVGTLSATSAFTGTKIASGEGAIYVPSALVDTYKSATNWSTYANQIYPITAYPVTDFSTISDSWDEIFAAESNGTYATKYSVGDTKQIDVNGTQVYMQIAAIDGDTLADSSGNAKISWVAKSILTTHNMNSSATTTGGWSATAMRTYLRDTILPTLPANVRAAIKEVTKTYKDYASSSTLSETDTIWIPSGREVFGGTSYEDSGVIYSGLFNSATARIKYNAAGTAAYWWLRSANGGSGFYNVADGGGSSNGNASNSYGVVFGFCT